MNSVTIKLSEQLMEYNVPSAVINKLAELDSNNVDLDLQGSVTLSGGVYESKVNLLTDKYQDFHITAPSTYIDFESPEIERVLVANGYSTDGVGITLLDAATKKSSITLDLFASNTSITNFNELSKFTAITGIGRGSFSNSSISEIDLSRITTIGNSAFRSCKSLKNLNLQSITSISELAFHSTIILSITLGNNITSLGNVSGDDYTQIFANATIGHMTIPTNITKIGGLTFGGATINLLDVDESVITWGGNFCNYVKDVWNYANLTNVSNGPYFTKSGQSTVLNQVYFPKITATKKATLWYGNRLRYSLFVGNRDDSVTFSLLYYRDILEFGLATFNNTTIDTLVINNVTPPSISLTYGGSSNDEPSVISNVPDFYTNIFTLIKSIQKLYVPDSAVATYQADTRYNSIGVDKILPISLCPKYATKELWEAAGKPVALIEEYM